MLNMQGTVSVAQANRSSTSMSKGERNAKRRELKDTLLEAQEFAFNECSTGAVHGVRKFSKDTVQL